MYEYDDTVTMEASELDFHEECTVPAPLETWDIEHFEDIC